jgi:hypothetical protein
MMMTVIAFQWSASTIFYAGMPVCSTARASMAVFEELFGRMRLDSSIAWVAANGPTFHNLRIEFESSGIQ